MSKKLTTFLVGIILALGLSFGFLVSPTSAHASAKLAPITTLETSPSQAKGEDDWFTSVTMIEFNTNQSDKSVKTYFQWNQTDGKWQLYKEPFRAWKGENTLYYYSVNSRGKIETVKSTTIKVDYIKPVIENLKSVSTDGIVTLTWLGQKNVVSYRIYKLIDRKYVLIAQTKTNSYIDRNVQVGSAYVYAVKAIDQAGLNSKLKTTWVKVSDIPSLVKSQAQIDQEIGKGATISDLKKQPIENTPKTENTSGSNLAEPQEPAKKPARNWNHLLVAISILVIAIGAAIGGYYGYEAWVNRKTTTEKKEKKSNSRW